MDPIDLAHAKSHPGAPADRVEPGQPVKATRRGKPVARLTSIASPRKRVDIVTLQDLTAATPPQDSTVPERSMRDDERY